jgi:two-component system, OmpR family, response regulator MprA
MSAQVLCIEDDEDITHAIGIVLRRAGFDVIGAADGKDGLRAFHAERPDVVLLDIGLPTLDGWEVLERIRDLSDVPVIMLTAHGLESEKVRGLALGADDYLTKPFSFDVLLARVRALGRRGEIPQPVVLEAAGLTLHLGTREVRRGVRRIELTRTEYAILELLMRNSARVLSREYLIESVWGHDTEIENNTLDAFVRLLRAKIEAAGEPRVLTTVRGVGYCLRGETA